MIEKNLKKGIWLKVSILGIFSIAILYLISFAIGTSIAKEEMTIQIFSGTDPYFVGGTLGDPLGFYKNEGLDVQVKMFSSGTAAMEAFRAGRAQFLLCGANPTLNLLSEGDTMVLALTASGPSALYARKGISKASDLRGKKIAVKLRSDGEAAIIKYLERGNIKPNEVELINMAPSDGVAALDRGDVDAHSSWEPYGWKQEEVSGNKVVSLGGDHYRIICFVSVNKKFAQENPQMVKKVLKAFVRGEKWMQDSPLEEKVKAVSSHIKLDPELTGKMLSVLVYDPSFSPAMKTYMQYLENFMLERKALPRKIDWSKADGTYFLKELDPSMVKQSRHDSWLTK